MSDVLTIAVLVGGPSAEAEVSRNSGAQVAAALAANGHSIHELELDQHAVKQLIELRPDVVFPVLHGPPGEDGTVQGMLEMLGLPYVGSDVRGSAFAMDKAVAKDIFQRADLPVLSDLVIYPDAPISAQARRIEDHFGTSIVVKPLNQGSALGVTPMPEGGDIEQAIASALQYGPCLVEPYLAGMEATVGILDRGDRLEAFPVIEIRTADNEWYDYENRYAVGQSEHVMPPNLSEDCQTELKRIAEIAHRALGLRDLSRADFIVGEAEEIILLEVNTLPGMTPTSLYPDAAANLGYAFRELMDILVQQAYKRRPSR